MAKTKIRRDRQRGKSPWPRKVEATKVFDSLDDLEVAVERECLRRALAAMRAEPQRGRALDGGRCVICLERYAAGSYVTSVARLGAAHHQCEAELLDRAVSRDMLREALREDRPLTDEARSLISLRDEASRTLWCIRERQRRAADQRARIVRRQRAELRAASADGRNPIREQHLAELAALHESLTIESGVENGLQAMASSPVPIAPPGKLLVTFVLDMTSEPGMWWWRGRPRYVDLAVLAVLGGYRPREAWAKRVAEGTKTTTAKAIDDVAKAIQATGVA